MNVPSVLIGTILCFILLVAPRRYFLYPFIIAACLIPMHQRIDFFGLDFTLLRLLILTGFLRIKIRKETRSIQWNRFDKLFLSWVLVGSLVYVAQYGTFAASLTRSGVIFDSVGMYWIVRQIIRVWGDVFQAIKIFAALAIITAPLIALEKFQEWSFFSLFGPVTAQFHNGRFRAAGSFPHYIIMGCFWVNLLPLFYARIKSKKNIIFFWVALLSALSNIYCSASSTPVLTLLSIILLWNLYNYRSHGKVIFGVICFGIFILHMVMKKPVWHLISRINVFEGSTGWHRFFLFDNFVNHISEWYLLGVKSTEHWGNVQFDLTNQFVLEGVRGGMITLLIFIALLFNAVKIPGRISLSNVSPEIQWINWGICTTMLGHFVTFWGVSYFGQINMLLYFTLALVGFALEQSVREPIKTRIAPSPI